MKKYNFILMLIAIFCLPAAAQQQGQTEYSEFYRNQYHFSPKKGWIGDPSGLVHFDGKYHLYFWGAVESTDMVHMKEISPKSQKGVPDSIACFTGSVAIDKENSAGYGKNAYIAAFTMYDRSTKKQAQAISYCNDGREFHFISNNPVLDLWSTEFRDPTVFWHEGSHQWVMVVSLALEKKVLFYGSKDMRQWTYLSSFGPAGDSMRSWECPDLFKLKVGNGKLKGQEKWVLLVSINWAQEQYFIGDFDGKKFTADEKAMFNTSNDSIPLKEWKSGTPLLVDKGLDFYASRTVRDYDGDMTETPSIGWVATWDYAPKAPTTYGKGFWSIARNYSLRECPEGLRLIQTPVPALKELRGKAWQYKKNIPAGVTILPEISRYNNVYELDANFTCSKGATFGFDLCVGEGRKVRCTYDVDSENFTIDRTNCSKENIEKFSRMTHAKVTADNGKLHLRVFVDKSVVEIFTGEGKDVFTLCTYPSEEQTGMQLFTLNKGTEVSLTAWPLQSIWK